MTRKLWTSLTLIAAAAALSACGGGDDGDATLRVQFNGLEDLGASAVYEGWIMVDGAPVTTGRFSINSAGKPSQTDFIISRAQADRATAFVLTIEPATGDVPAASNQHVLAGDFNSARTSASLTIGHAAAFGNNFSSARGSFFLATPTSASTTDDDQGIWFIDPSSGTMQPSLTLPTLPNGWVYEGWVVVNGKPVSTGRFSTAMGADSDAGGAAAGPLAAPPFPGQDFINPATKLPGGMAVISIEPQPDNSPAPFALKPLINTNIANLVGGANPQTLTNQAASNAPTGAISIIR